MFTPTDLGLPQKFQEYRLNQLDVALDIAASARRFSFLSAAPGSGKSPCYMTIAQVRVPKGRTLVLTGTRYLQTQLVRDFESMGMLSVQGQSNYPCRAVQHLGELEGWAPANSTCEEGPCHTGVHCSLKKGGCGYYDQVRRGSTGRITVGNYALWLSGTRHTDPNFLGKYDLLICDEAHTAPTWLTNFCAVELEPSKIKALLGLDLPSLKEGLDVWAAWARRAADMAKDGAKDIRQTLDEGGFKDTSQRYSLHKKALKLVRLGRDLDELAGAQAWRNTEGPAKDVRLPGMRVDWIGYEQRARDGSKVVRWSPVWAHAYAEAYLFRGIPKVVLSSGTMVPSIKQRLGIRDEDSDWHEAASTFPSIRRPVYYFPARRPDTGKDVRVDRRMDDLDHRLWMARIDEIVGAMSQWKGIVATVSYDRANDIKAHSRHAEHMLVHDSKTSRETLDKFKAASAPCVLVSPAVVEGIDLPYDLCRFIILAKVPFGDSRDPLYQARRRMDKSYPNECAAMTMIQTSFRGMRAADDWCAVFCVDGHFSWLMYQTQWPQWYKMAWRTVDKMPRIVESMMARKASKERAA